MLMFWGQRGRQALQEVQAEAFLLVGMALYMMCRLNFSPARLNSLYSVRHVEISMFCGHTGRQ